MTGAFPWIGLAALIAVAAFFGIAVFERFAPRRWVRAYQKHLGNPTFRFSAGILPGWAVIETTGRRTGLRRRTPVGGRRNGDTYWLIAGFDRSDFVRNIEANPRVRLRHHGRWREGVAHVCGDEDPRRRLWTLNPVNGLFLWLVGTKRLRTVRVDLEPR